MSTSSTGLIDHVAVAAPATWHVIGAPEPQIYGGAGGAGGAAPAELARAFIYAATIANGVFWLALGGAFGYLTKKLTSANG